MTVTQDLAVLDNVVWYALATRQANFALGEGLARRFQPDVAPFIGVADPNDPATIDDIEQLVRQTGDAVFFTKDQLQLPADRITKQREGALAQLVLHNVPQPSNAFEVVELVPDDVPEMIALVELTKPGPYKERTIQLGRYIGIRHEGKLIAMAGERLKPEGFTEISAVCVHPDHRGKGYAAELVLIVANHIAARGDTPFLHTGSTNTPAISLYLKLGFERRPDRWVTVVTPA